jgi:ubiquinone/menaquinone biosynthesis C-methylase UbiE
MSAITIITGSRDRLREHERGLRGMRPRGGLVAAKSLDDLRDQLRRLVDAATGIADGSIQTQAVIVDGKFGAGSRAFSVTDPLYREFPDGANSLIAMLQGAGIPVLVDPRGLSAECAYAVARAGGRLIKDGQLRRQVGSAIAHVAFNRETLKVENDFARGYDTEELGGAATVSAILSENEFVVSQLREFAKEHTGGLRILDLGCGTGRFEELLLTDPKLRSKITQIVAVDFAPRYLVEARRRLPHFLKPIDMRKIVFLRRIAEDLHFPRGYFDVVLASFGVVCFSRSHLTLQQVSKVTRTGGLALFNGYNRSALTYEFDAKIARTDNPVTHFAIHIDKDKNRMHLGSSVIDCMTFDVPSFENLLRLVGLNPATEHSRTFPTLYGAARRDYLNELASPAASLDPGREHASCHKPGTTCSTHLSYQDENLVEHTDSGFHDLIHKMDADLERVLDRQGFYFSVAAHKGPADS